jgi:hypothetical protein
MWFKSICLLVHIDTTILVPLRFDNHAQCGFFRLLKVIVLYLFIHSGQICSLYTIPEIDPNQFEIFDNLQSCWLP